MLTDVSLVWLSFMKQGLRCARSVGYDPVPNINSRPVLSLMKYVLSISVFYVTIFITSDVIEHEKWKVSFFF